MRLILWIFSCILHLVIESQCFVGSGCEFLPGCKCELNADSELLADCSIANLTEVPNIATSFQVKLLNLRYNRITRIGVWDFTKFQYLEELNLQGNLITRIEEESFAGLHSLKKLDLSKNFIGYLSQRTVDKLPKSLTWLSLEMNSISRIPNFSDFRNLTSLDFSRNRFIKEITADLKTLTLHDNMASSYIRFEEGVFNDLASLEYLSLSRCYCRELPRNSFVKMAKLKTLLLNNCWLKEPPLLSNLTVGGDNKTYLEKLQQLDLSNNRQMVIKSSQVRFPRSLEELYLTRNNIPEVDEHLFQGLAQLRKLDMRESMIVHMHENAFSDLRSVEEIYLSRNPLENIPEIPQSLYLFNATEIAAKTLNRTSLGKLQNAVEMNLSNSQIEAIEDHAFENLVSLRTLDLSRNKVEVVGKYSLRVGISPSRKVKRAREQISSMLQHLNLSLNIIRRIDSRAFCGHAQLLRLDLQGNTLQTVHGGIFKCLRNLRELNLDRNNLKSIPPEALRDLRGLEVLRIAFNKIEVIEPRTFQSLKNLKELYLGSNFIHTFKAATFQSLQLLDISSNGLRKLPRLDGRRIQTIVASNNFIKRITPNLFEHLVDLRYLTMRHNKIKYINYSAFIHTPKLVELDLASNRIGNFINESVPSLRKLSFQENEISLIYQNLKNVVPNIEYLYVGFNNISSVHPAVFRGLDRLKKLDLSANIYHCDCALQPFASWVNDNKDMVVDYEFHLCEQPADFYAIPITEIINDLNCSKTEEALTELVDTNVPTSIVIISVSSLIVLLSIVGILHFVYIQVRSFNERTKCLVENGSNNTNACKPALKWCATLHTHSYSKGKKEKTDEIFEQTDSNRSSTVVSAVDMEE